MTVVRRIVIGYAGLLILVIAMVVVVVTQVAPLQSAIKDYSDSTRAQVEAASTIVESAANMENAALIYVVTYDEAFRAKQTARLKEEAAGATAALDSIDAQVADGSETQATVEGLRILLGQYLQAANNVMTVGSTKTAEALTLTRNNLIPLSDRLSSTTESLKTLASDAEAAEANRLSGNAGRTWLIMLIMAAVVIIGGVVSSVTIPQTIRRQLHTAVAGINASASELLAVSSQVSAGAAQTAASTNETTATVEEVKQTALLAQEKAAQVAESSANVARVAESGRTTVEETIACIESMQSQMGVVAESINRLSEQTQAVGDIITIVNDLAEQSNLLSVNASIEAAKAGDHGKGFTVVAQEVKSLAEQSKQAVAQVRTILGEIRKASTMAVDAAKRGSEAIETGRGQSLESGEAIYALAESVNESAQSAQQISTSSRQQLAGMEQISQAIDSIDQASTQSVSGTRQVEEQVKRLQDLALRLKRLVDAKATVEIPHT
jgi:methyl-accepting chemotaxis protein